MARTGSIKRKSQPAPAKSRYLSKSSKKRKKTNDLYEAQDSDPDEERHAQRYDRVENYEYEMPSDFEDEEIDEDLAFTEEDKKKYAGWFGDDADGSSGEDGEQKHDKKRFRSEFADLESAEEETGEDENEEIIFDEGEEEDDMQRHGLGSDDEQQQALSDDGGGVGGGSSEGEGSEGEAAESDDESESGSGEEDEDWDDDKHRAMLAAALGNDAAAEVAAPQRHKKTGAAARNAVVAEAYNESEAHAAAAGGGAGELRLADLLEGLAAGAGTAGGGLGGARKLLERLDKKGQPVAAPLPRTVAERLERKAGYEATKQEVTKWQPIVKSNREAPTLRFTSARHEVGQAAGSSSALVAGFTPAADDPDGLEAQVAALLGAAGSAAAAAMEEADLALAEKHYSMEEAKARADRLAKMRHLLFYAELKAKRLAKIKSKEHHRRANKAAKRAAARLAESAGDEQEAARKAEEDAEFERAKERLTLKHKNSSKWARRALKRGQPSLDPSLREAIAAQLALGQQLRRKMEGGTGTGGDTGSDSDASTSASEPEAQQAAGTSSTAGRLMVSRNRKEALALLKGLAEPAATEGGLAGDDAAAAASEKKGLFALPFMVRALEKQRALAAQEAAALLEGMEGQAQQAVAAARASTETTGGDAFGAGSRGRFTFGGAAGGAAAAAAAHAAVAEAMSDSDEEEDVEAKAERLSRHLAGNADAADPAEKATMLTIKQQKAAAAEAASQQQQQQQTRHLQPDVGYVNIELPGSQAAAVGKTSRAVKVTTAAATGGLPEAHSQLFESRAKQQQQQQQHNAAEARTLQQLPFLSSKVWQGPKAGYVFKQDKQGLGYYLDKQQHAQQGRKKGKGKGQQQLQQQQLNGVQAALQRQQQAGAGSSNNEADAAPGLQQQQAGVQQQDTMHAAAKGGSAAAGVDAMQLLSGNGDLQRQLLQAAFAGDDVEADFAAEKAAEVEAELPPAEVAGALPGWGTWAAQQKEPAWMVAAKARVAAKRETAAASRKDAQLKHVIISEKWDKKSAKYLAASLPFPFKDNAVYEQAIRQPLGRQYNPDAAFRNLTRPAVLKDTGVVIQPLRFSKQVEQYNAKADGTKGRAVVTVAGGMQLQGQAAGSGAGGVGKGAGGKKTGKAAGGSKSRAAAAGSQKRMRLHSSAASR